MRWTRELLGAAGVDLTAFRPYSVKAAGVSSAASSLSLHTLMSSVGWRRDSTFRVLFYIYWPVWVLCSRAGFGLWALFFVLFIGCVIHLAWFPIVMGHC